jgi:undecaprenyl diphosphate synthase
MPEAPSDVAHRLPAHVAIIMDGNGRWARARGLPRAAGHRAGAEALRTVSECCAQWGIPYLTAYAFSTENWSRPPEEIDFLMNELRRFLRERRREMVKNGICLRAIGRLHELPASVRKELEKAREATARGSALALTLALNYGGRAEIVDACRALAREAAEGRLSPEQIDEPAFAAHLYAPDLPDPDLLIRTAGEMRVSNFLLWQIHYAEIYVTDTPWPDFGREQLHDAIRAYAARERRFGRVGTDRAPDGAGAPPR